jgi:hypothetical protein
VIKGEAEQKEGKIKDANNAIIILNDIIIFLYDSS